MCRRKPRLTYAEFWAVLLITVIAVGIAVPAVSLAHARGRSSCAGNLKQLGVVFKMYADENKEYFPPLSPIPDNWIPDAEAVYPEYLSDLSVLICPSSRFARPETFRLADTWDHPDGKVGAYHPDCVSSLFYVYTGYVIQSDEQAFGLFDASQRTPWETVRSGKLEFEVPVWEERPNGDRGARRGMPLLWDRVPLVEEEFSHRPLGGNVLHMDGSVQFVRYNRFNSSNYFPITRVSGETFGSVLPALSCDCR